MAFGVAGVELGAVTGLVVGPAEDGCAAWVTAGCAAAEEAGMEALLTGGFEAEDTFDADGSFAVEALG